MDYGRQKTVNGLKAVPKKDGSEDGEMQSGRESGGQGFQDFTAI